MSKAIANGALARNVRRLGHLDLPGAGQVNIDGRYAYVGHIPNKEDLGTSIVDIADPANPRLVATVTVDDPTSHSHKVRVAGDLMVVNHERNPTAAGRRAQDMPAIRRELREALGRDPTRAELLQRLTLTEADLVEIEKDEKQPYRNGGFPHLRRIDAVEAEADPSSADRRHRRASLRHGRALRLHLHRDGRLPRQYPGDLRPARSIAPKEVSRWWIAGQHIAAGEKPTWPGKRHRLHHALRFGNEMFASCWHGGFRIVDVTDLAKPKTVASYNYHPPFPEPTHTVMPVPGKIGGKRIALVDRRRRSGAERQRGRGAPRPPACRNLRLRRVRLRQREAAVAVRSERTRFAVCPHAGRALRRASVPRTHDRHAGARGVVRRRLAHYRRRRSDGAARGRLFHSRSGRRPRRAAKQRRDARRRAGSFMSWTATSASTCWSLPERTSRHSWTAPWRRARSDRIIPPRPIKRRGIGAERLARLRVEIKHVPAAIELELRAAGRRRSAADGRAHSASCRRA